MQTLAEFIVCFEQGQRQADEVIKVHSTSVGEGTLVVRVDAIAKLCQRQRRERGVEFETQLFGSQEAVFGGADKGKGNGVQ